MRKRSPSAPTMALAEALDRAIAVYKKEDRHPAPTDVVAQNMGYKDASSGAAMKTIAALTSYGLLNRSGTGKLAVSDDVQSYQFAPDPEMKRQLLVRWLESPTVFKKLLSKYGSSLPSDSTIRFDLIQEGFKPGTAESVLGSFKKSIEFARYFDNKINLDQEDQIDEQASPMQESIESTESNHYVLDESNRADHDLKLDRIPVRLDATRRAWLEIPTPFYELDKNRLKAQIDLLLTDDEDEGSTGEGT